MWMNESVSKIQTFDKYFQHPLKGIKKMKERKVEVGNIM